MAKKPMDLHELKSLLSSEKQSAMGAASSSKLAEERTQALDYYEGNMPDMPNSQGRSGAVSTDVLEAVEALMPPLMEIFASSDEVVRFAPVGPEDEEAADQETDYVNHVFMQKNPGFITLYSFIKDALLSKVGIVKVFWEETTKESRETYSDLSEDEYALVKASVDADDDAEIIEDTINGQDDEKPGAHNVVVAWRREHGVARVEPVPPEEFLISKKARSLSGSTYCAHRVYRTRGELIEQGFDRDQVMSLSAREQAMNVEEVARNTVEDFQARNETQNDVSNLVEVIEHYIKCDYEGDGVQRIYKVTAAGTDGDILKTDDGPAVEPVDAFPFAAMTPFIMTHRFFGRSVADLVIEIQRIKTALLRALLDNTYMANNQRMEVAESGSTERTLDDLLTNRPGGVVRVKTPGTVNPLQSAPIGPFVYPLIEYLDGVKESRIGSTKLGQGLDANALQNQTATAADQAFSAAQARVKLIARVFAETGIKDMFSLLHAVIRKNSTKADIIRLRNKWIDVDPRDWRERNDMTIDVGLGSGTKSQQVANLMQVLTIQKEALMNPGTGLAAPTNVYNTLSKLLPLMGQKNVDLFFSDPAKNPQPQQPPPPDPKMLEVQAKAQAAQAQMQIDAQAKQAEMQQSAAIEVQKMQQEVALKREQMAAEMQLKREQMLMEMQLKREAMMMQAQISTSVGNVEMGGAVG